MFEAYSRPVVKSYRVSCCSLGAIFWASCIVAVVLAPLYSAWLSHAFWITETVAYEQPQVLDNGKYVIIVDGMRPDSSGTAEPFQIVSTSSYGLNALLGSTFRAPVIQTAFLDTNLDGRPDSFDLNVSIPLRSQEQIFNFMYISSVSVNFKVATRVVMDGLVVFQSGSGIPGSSVSAVANLALQQAYPVHAGGGLKDLYTTEALPLDTFQSVDELSVEAILSAYTSRNLTTRLANVAPVWKADTASSFQLPFATRSFSASLHVRVEEVQLRLFPFITQVIKQGWIQYVSFLLIALWVIDVIKHFVFSQGIVTSVVVNEAGPAPLGAKFPRKLHLW